MEEFEEEKNVSSFIPRLPSIFVQPNAEWRGSFFSLTSSKDRVLPEVSKNQAQAFTGNTWGGDFMRFHMQLMLGGSAAPTIFLIDLLSQVQSVETKNELPTFFSPGLSMIHLVPAVVLDVMMWNNCTARQLRASKSLTAPGSFHYVVSFLPWILTSRPSSFLSILQFPAPDCFLFPCFSSSELGLSIYCSECPDKLQGLP